jgi:DivIVA domain-containing protein
MSLTLDQIRNIKFRMAKRSGYEVLDVDEFVDQVEASFEQLLEENENLKRQVESLTTTTPAAEPQPAAAADDRVTAEQPAVASGATDSGAGAERVVVTSSAEASSAVARMVQLATEQAEVLVTEAQEQATQIKSEAEQTAKQVTADAGTRAERMESEARVTAERVRSEAQSRADRLDRDTADKRTELFSQLEQERDTLAASVTELRKFESDFRQNLTNELRGHIDSLTSATAEPSPAPAALADAPSQGGSENTVGGQNTAAEGDGRSTDAAAEDDAEETGDRTSQTPRLDALLGDQR